MIINSMHIMSLLSVVKSQSIQVGTNAIKIPNNPLTGRKVLVIRNADSSTNLKIGGSDSQDYTLTAGQSISFNIPENVNIYGKSESGTITVEILEFS